MKQCKLCGEMFLPPSPASKICGKIHIQKCPVCGNDMIWNSMRPVEPCSQQCRRELTKRKNLEKYGVEHPMQSAEVQARHKAAMLEKYGVESPLQLQEFKDKAKQTNREKFGADWALSNTDIKNKSRQTMREQYGAETTLQSGILRAKYEKTMKERYGTDNPLKCESIRERVYATNFARYGVVNPMQRKEIARKVAESRRAKLDEIWQKSKTTWMTTLGVDNPSKSQQVIDKMTDTFLKRYGVVRAIDVPEFREKMQQTMIARYGVPYYHMTEEFRHSQHFRVSKINRQFAERLNNQGIETEFEFRLDTRSYDLKLKDSNVLIEIDPTYTHNIIGNHWCDGIDKYYHRDKSQLAEENGYRCIHVFDWDDLEKVVQLLTKPTRRVFARKCTIYRLNKNVGDEFLQHYHIQGTCRGQLLYLGLVHEGELLQVMTFGRSRFDKNYDVELLRLCTKPGVIVVGGASKLFSYATNEYGLSKIISYCDRAKFNGDVYTRIGMKFKRVTPPQEIWSKGSNHITANLLRSRGYDQLFGTNYGKGTSNETLMLQDGWLPIFDCGQKVFVYD